MCAGRSTTTDTRETMLTQNTLETLRHLKLHGIAQALEEQRDTPNTHALSFCILELKSNGNPAGRGSRSVILSAAVAAARSAAGTSSGRGNSPLRIISTIRVPALDEILDGIDERHMENVHRQIDGA